MQRNRQIPTIIGIIAIVIVSIAAVVYYSFFTFHITKTDPGLERISRYSPIIRINFNKELSRGSSDIVILNKDNISKVEVEGKQLRLFLKNINPDVDSSYTVTINKLLSKDKQYIIKDKRISFSTKDIEFSEMSEADQKLIIDQQDLDQPSRNADPAFDIFPYGTLDYTIDFDQDKTLTVQLLLSNADVKINRQSAIDRYQAEAQTYLESLDLKLENYIINYVVVDPS